MREYIYIPNSKKKEKNNFFSLKPLFHINYIFFKTANW